MNIKCIRVIIILLGLIAMENRNNQIWGQYYGVGEEPAKTKWIKASSENFEIIMPKTLAQYKCNNYLKYLHLIEQHYGIFSDSIRYNTSLSRRFPTIVHPFNAHSNGLTVWAPRRIEYYSMYYTGISYPQNWMEQLVLHEGRHAWQIAHFNQGFWRFATVLFGEQAIGLASGVYPSRWMLEGDAVVAETERSDYGRGRNGDFLSNTLLCIEPTDNSYKTVYNKNRSWDRWRFGSVKYFSPSAYDIGYLINAMARYKSGDYNLTHKILSNESNGIINPDIVASSFRKYTSLSHKDFISGDLLQQFYTLNTNLPFQRFLQGYNVKNHNITGNAGKQAGADRGYYTSFYNIVEISDGKLIAGVTGYGSSPYLVLFEREGDNWKSRNLRRLSLQHSGFSTNGKKVFWSEPITDKRWGQIAVNKLFALDLATNSIENIKAQSEYLYSPMACRDTLYAIEYFPTQEKSAIVRILDLNNGANLYNSNNHTVCEIDGQITEICNAEGKIYFTHIEEGGMAIYRADSSPVRIVKPIKHAVKEIIGSGSNLFFLSDYFGEDMLCTINPNKEEQEFADAIQLLTPTQHITSFDYNSSTQKLYLTKKDGDRGAFVYEEFIERPIELRENFEFDFPLAKELSRQYEQSSDHKAISQFIPDSNSLEIRDYSKLSHLFKIHSWTPVYTDISTNFNTDYETFVTQIKPGATILSQNTLGTMVAVLGYSYERDKNHHSKNLHAAHARATYRGFYPIIEANLHYNSEPMFEKGRQSFKSTIHTYIPFNLSRNGWQSQIAPQVYWDYKNYEETLVEHTNSAGEKYYTIKQIDRHQVGAALSMYKVLPVAKAQFYPRLGIGTRWQTAFNPAGGDNFGSIYMGQLYGYLPGLLFNQSLKLSIAYQWQDAKKYLMDNILSEPRGYTDDIYANKLFRASVDYAIPLYLGDISLGFVAYLKSVNIVPFFDLGLYRRTIKNQNIWRNRSSFGVDITFRTHLFRIGYPLSIGMRYAHTTRPKDIGGLTYSLYKERYLKSGVKDYFGLILEIEI